MNISELLSRRRFGAVTALLVMGLLAGACSTVDATKTLACPSVQVLASLGEFVRFKPGPGRDPTDVATEAWIERVGGECVLENGEYIVELLIGVGIRRGPVNQLASANLKYFVAVVDRQESILQRQSFVTTAPFGSFKSATFEDAIEVRIPAQNGAAGDAFTIFVGFELSPDELRYNRRKTRP